MRKKVELPIASDAELLALITQFESLTLPYENWTHRAHLAVAVGYLNEYPFEEALERTREKIGAYNRACGDPDGYHETITVCFLMKIDSERTSGRAAHTLHEEVERLSNLCTIDWLHSHYSPGLLASAKAKSGWVEPDRNQLPS